VPKMYLSFADTRKKAPLWHTRPFLNLNAHWLPWCGGSKAGSPFVAVEFTLIILVLHFFLVSEIHFPSGTVNCELLIASPGHSTGLI
jgi:hypothetical protein